MPLRVMFLAFLVLLAFFAPGTGLFMAVVGAVGLPLSHRRWVRTRRTRQHVSRRHRRQAIDTGSGATA